MTILLLDVILRLFSSSLGRRERVIALLILVRTKILTFNLFKKRLSDVQHGIRSTRLYVLLLVVGMIIASLYSAVGRQTDTVTVNNPTEDQHEQLSNQSSIILSCPCRRLSMSYDSFVSIEPRFHQVCSSAFVQREKWLSYWPVLFVNGTRPTFNPFDFRRAGSTFFSLLNEYCELSATTIANAVRAFNSTQFNSVQAFPQERFITQVSFAAFTLQQEVWMN